MSEGDGSAAARRRTGRAPQTTADNGPWEEHLVKYLFASTLISASLFVFPSMPAVAQSIDIGPGGVRVDPRSSRERDRDEIRRDERREEFRDERRGSIRREERLRRDGDDDDDD
ncbi:MULTISPECIES: hypothetical protein [Methylobacterium]|jgi:hypothetical protein|uniref:Transmembrane protein n=1 Tax=Methylobacterium longum TaxID=767694 RepID=A0ABT8AKP2_9HYPH|nr:MULTISPECIES: hypothetical protein [Methylobacterium]MCJ2098017.1 hypothetical protein [Methylobacterium sp. E-046]MDN3570473.1 hypothetical protein [Methylobacterium longum]